MLIFPEYYFETFKLLDYLTYVKENQSKTIIQSIKEWERELTRVNLSTKSICSIIHKAIK